MNLLPVIQRELLVRAKGRGTYWTRFVVALLGLVVCLPLLALGEGADPALAGRFAFNCMATCAFLLSCASCLLTADVISAERRDGTLGLLFLTRLSGFEILLGKLASVGLAAACGLVVLLPVLILPVLAGGVTGGGALRSALVLLDTLFLGLVAGLWASVREQESVRAARKALLLIACLVLLPAMLEAVVRLYADGFTSGVGLLSPLVTILDAEPTTGPEAARYWVSLILVQGLAWALVARADVKLRHSLRDVSADSPPPAPQGTRGWAGTAAPRAAAPGDDDPIEWLVRHQPGIRTTLWAAGILSIVYSTFNFLLHLAVGFPLPGFLGVIMRPVALAVSLTVEGLVARASSRFLFEAHRSGQLEVLLTTPCGAQAILSGQWRALGRLLRWPIGLPILVGLVGEITTMARGPASLADTGHFWSVSMPVTCLLEVAGTVGGVVTACWLGMWFGIRGHTPLATMARATGLTTGIPFLFKMLATFALAIPIGRLFGQNMEVWLVFAWAQVVVVLFYYGWLIYRTRRRLLAELSGREPRSSRMCSPSWHPCSQER